MYFYIVGDDLYPQEPDIFGDHPPLIVEGTIKELNEKHKNLNRSIMKETERDFPKYVTFLCNVTLGDEHVIPITDMSFLGIPKVRF